MTRNQLYTVVCTFQLTWRETERVLVFKIYLTHMTYSYTIQVIIDEEKQPDLKP